MAQRFTVETVDEALTLARQFRDQGTYDWFRGQAVDWRIRSSMARLDDIGRDDAKQRLARLRATAEDDPELAPLVADFDKLLAVAQHYGLPTNLVDFSTSPDVAAFFAVHGDETRIRADQVKARTDLSAIVLLNTSEFTWMMQTMVPVLRLQIGEEFAAPDVLRLDVNDLWRLHAQHGVFLFNPLDDIEKLYDFDRIVFPFKPTPPPIDTRLVYPDRKSRLEIRLDHYFMNEVLIRGSRELTFKSRMMGISVPPSPVVHGEYFTSGDPGVHESWAAAHSTWIPPHGQHFHDANRPLELRLRAPVANCKSFQLQVQSQVEQLLSQRVDARRLLLRVDASALAGVAANVGPKMSKSMHMVWDGLRGWPYSDRTLAIAMANTAAIVLKLGSQSAPTADEDAYQAEPDNAVEVEFGYSRGSYSRATIGSEWLDRTLRSDIESCVALHARQYAAFSVSLMQICRDPKRLFDYGRFSNLWAEQIVPRQAVFRPTSSHYFAPVEVEVFGLA